MKLFITILLACFLFGCQTIENKADKIGKKEIEEMSKFLQQPESELKIAMGSLIKLHMMQKVQNFLFIRKKNTASPVKKSLR